MRVAVLSDIHGNLPALESVAAEVRDADAVICLGDVVNYGPWGDECLELLQALPHLTLLEGNHERLFLGREPIAGERPLVQQFFHAAFPRFTRRDLIEALPAEVHVGGFLFCHTLEHRHIDRDTDIVPASNAFIGHTHHAFHLERAGKHLVNPGSVGQNRARLDQACYAFFDTDTHAAELRHVSYAADLLLVEMTRLEYPAECLAYYRSKL